MAVARSRNRYNHLVTRFVTYNGSTVSNVSHFLEYEKTDDVIENYGNKNALHIHKYCKRPFLFYGTNGGYEYENLATLLSKLSHLPNEGLHSTEAAAMIAARTNPSRPHVSLPVAVAELLGAPVLIRNLGKMYAKAIAKGAPAGVPKVKPPPPPRDEIKAAEQAGYVSSYFASSYLTWEFGLKPLISDVLKLIEFFEAYENRVNEIDRLVSKGGLKRKRTLHNEEVEESHSKATINSTYSCWVKATAVTRTTLKVWASIEWKPVPGFSHLNYADQLHRLRELMLGLHPSSTISNIWEGLPWSWLIDWAANVGEVLQAYNNSVAYAIQPVCVMKHYHTQKEHSIVQIPSGVDAWDTPLGHSTVDKYRILQYPGLAASVPFLGARKLSILGSLSILYGR